MMVSDIPWNLSVKGAIIFLTVKFWFHEAKNSTFEYPFQSWLPKQITDRTTPLKWPKQIVVIQYFCLCWLYTIWSVQILPKESTSKLVALRKLLTRHVLWDVHGKDLRFQWQIISVQVKVKKKKKQNKVQAKILYLYMSLQKAPSTAHASDTLAVLYSMCCRLNALCIFSPCAI